MTLAVKKIITAALLPPASLLIILALALFLLFFTKKQRWGRLLALAGVLGILVFSLPSSAALLLEPLEKRYPPLVGEETQGARYIVVLTAATYGSGGAKHNLGTASLARSLETLRLCQHLPTATVLVSGDPPSAAAMTRLLQELGIDKARIASAGMPLDTLSSIQKLKKIVGTNSFVLVSSASHLPRVMLLAKQHGLSPLPAPCDYSANPEAVSTAQRFLPEAKHMARSALALKEYYGIAYYWLLGNAREN
jgi:uncharacterized SAM-binding protein YcdF (DUF218 family)